MHKQFTSNGRFPRNVKRIPYAPFDAMPLNEFDNLFALNFNVESDFVKVEWKDVHHLVHNNKRDT